MVTLGLTAPSCVPVRMMQNVTQSQGAAVVPSAGRVPHVPRPVLRASLAPAVNTRVTVKTLLGVIRSPGAADARTAGMASHVI